MTNPWENNQSIEAMIPNTNANQNTNQYGLGIWDKLLGTRKYSPATGAVDITGLGGTQGLADLGSGLASLYSIYAGYQANKRANEAYKLQKAEYNRGVQKDKDFATNMNKSGLGTYSAGV